MGISMQWHPFWILREDRSRLSQQIRHFCTTMLLEIVTTASPHHLSAKEIRV